MLRPDFADRAQTNIQLYNQLIELGFSRADVSSADRAYSIAARIFAGLVRPEGRPFVCHAVGVASILADLGQDARVVCAGLVHSAYTHGDFGAGRAQVGGRDRDDLRRTLGPDVAALIDAYSKQAWGQPETRDWTARAGKLDLPSRTLVLLRLADALEDALDFGLDYSAKGERHAGVIPRADIVALAEALVLDRLAAALRQAYARHAPGDYLEDLREEVAGSEVLAPLSYRRRIVGPILARLTARARRKISSRKA